VRQRDQPPDQFRATARHPHVGEHQRRAVLARGRHGVVAGGGLTHDAEVRLLLQQPRDRGSDQVVVVRDDDGDLTAGWGQHRTTFAQIASVCPDARVPAV
jgi:hypothetical protein